MQPTNYLQSSPRLWSRVQNSITFQLPGTDYTQSYIPLINKTVSSQDANYYDKLLYKGNVLQYKANSFQISKKHHYSRLARGFGTKTFATQSQTYSNPNNRSLLRINSSQMSNNTPGTFQYNVPNPSGCSTDFIEVGGNLVCGNYTNPCSGEILKTSGSTAQKYFPTYYSDVPGPPILLSWNSNSSSYFPRQRRVMSASIQKIYKNSTSATSLVPPILSLSQNENSVILSWSNTNSVCGSISSYNIYENNIFVYSVSYLTTTTQINNLITGNTYSFYITSVTVGSNSESSPSNTVTIVI